LFAVTGLMCTAIGGCGSNLDQLRTKAAFEYKCEESDVKLTPLEGDEESVDQVVGAACNDKQGKFQWTENSVWRVFNEGDVDEKDKKVAQ